MIDRRFKKKEEMATFSKVFGVFQDERNGLQLRDWCNIWSTTYRVPVHELVKILTQKRLKITEKESFKKVENILWQDSENVTTSDILWRKIC